MNEVNSCDESSEKLAELHKKCFSCSWSVNEFNKLRELESTLTVGIKDKNQHFCGFVMLQCCNQTSEILTVCVDPIQQGNNYGKTLLRSAISLLKTMNVVEVFLEVSENNAAARHMYRILEFSVVGERRAYYSDGTSALLMKKKI